MDALGWNTLLFALKWVFIALVYFILVVVLLNVRRELSLRLKSAPAEEPGGFSPGRLRVINKGTDPRLRNGAVLELKPVTTLGALADNSLVVRDRFISGHHARLSWDGVGWTLEDLGSRNGTRVNSETVQPHAPVQLSNGALISLGDMTFELME